MTSKSPPPDAVRELPPDAMAMFRQATAMHQAGRLDEAETLYRRILSIDARQFPVLLMLGILLGQRANYLGAEAVLRDALQINPTDAGGQFNYANVLIALHRHDDALTAFEKALALNPGFAEAHLNRGSIFMMRNRFDEAIACFDAAIRINPSLSGAHCNRGNALEELKHFDEALKSYDVALELNPRNAEFHASRANVLNRLRRPEEALNALSTALALHPRNGGFHYNRGNILFELRRFTEAFEAYDKALALDPGVEYVESARLYSKMYLCDWSNFGADCSHLIASIEKGTVAQPFALLAISGSPDLQLRNANLLSKTKYPAAKNPLWRGERFNHDRIRVAYLSADFGEHAVSTLMAGVFEHHNRKRFEIFGISLEPRDPSEMLTRLGGSFDHFIDAKDRSDTDVAHSMRELEIDIAVDLTGYTKGLRPAIFALRPAPIQINYLGYPGTMGADYIDYMVADRFVAPDVQQRFYTEKIVYLPETFQANDSKRKIENTPASRIEVGLPENGFVFCSFNNSYKITPTCFDIWMRLLDQVSDSVLWLLGGDNVQERNLRREAEHRGVNSARLIFSTRSEYSKYLARYRLADLFLDTFPFNAGTTGSDALWAGLPIITCSGQTFASRMAGSLLHAIGLSELVTESLVEYEALALQLARDPDRLFAIKGQLARNRDVYPLFNAARFTRHLEAAFELMRNRVHNGKPPSSFAVEPID